MKKRHDLLLILIIFFLTASSPAYTDTRHSIKSTLNVQAFPGFEINKNKTSATLTGYEYQAIEGKTIKLENCNQAINTNSSIVADFEYFRFKQLVISCIAIQQFAKATDAKITWFPEKPDMSFYAELPAIVKPLLHKNEPSQLGKKTLGNYIIETNISIEMDNMAKIINSEDEIYVTLLARGDFTHDGIEDLLIKTEWYARKAFGKHADLLILTRTSKKALVNVYWRLNPPPRH